MIKMIESVSLRKELKITTWNVGGLKYNLQFLREHIAMWDIVCLQEHWLFPDDLGFLNGIDESFTSWGRSSSNLNSESLSRRGMGGLAFLWKKDLTNAVIPMLDVGSDRIMVLSLRNSKNEEIYIINVYLPSSSESAEIYQLHVAELQEIIYKLQNKGSIILLGDFNAHIGCFGGPRSFGMINRRGRMLWSTLNLFDFVSVNSQLSTEGPIETFYACSGAVRTTVDHVFVDYDLLTMISSCCVVEDCSSNLSFHLPITCSFDIDVIKDSPSRQRPKLQWKRLADPTVKKKYQDVVIAGLDRIIGNNAREVNDWVKNLDLILSELAAVLHHAANVTVPKKNVKPHVKRYWNAELTNLRRNVSKSRRIWIENGKPRGTRFESFANYKNAKREFRKAQRRAIYTDEIKRFENLENLHDHDRSLFYRQISKSSSRRSPCGSVLMENGVRITDPREVLNIWKEHYQDLYKPKDNQGFDDSFRNFVSQRLSEFSKETFVHENDPLDKPFDINEVAKVISNLPNGKAGGMDEIVYEHLKYGESAIAKFLTELFNTVRVSEIVPTNWGVGRVISILKGGKKNRMDRDSYRGITLLNVIGKVFERLFLNRWIPKFQEIGMPNDFQYAYQNSRSCILSSFCLQETVRHNVEMGSKVYCCFLDSSKAFDTVWWDGLFYKLYNMGMKGKSWRILREWYGKMVSSVVLGERTSPTFPVYQGVRQGGVLSPWLFLCYNNDLPEVLRSTGHGLTVEDIKLSSLLIADDITLLSLRVSGLQSLLNKVEEYSTKWRFSFNPSKSKIVTFGESTQQFNIHKQQRVWYLNGIPIDQCTTWEHVGILLSGNFSSTTRTASAIKKGRSVVGVIAEAGARAGGLNPICSSNIWRIFGLSAMTYGCELWCSLGKSEKEDLNRVTAFAAKRFQGLPVACHSDGAIGCLGMWTTMGYVDKAKLLFVGNVVRASPDQLHKKVFVTRLMAYLYGTHSKQYGFIPEILELLKKYELLEHLENYLCSGMFPVKRVWRNIVMDRVHALEEQLWRNRVALKPELENLSRTHMTLQPIFHWKTARKYPFSRVLIGNLVNLICGNIPPCVLQAMKEHANEYTCKLCQNKTSHIGFHLFMQCSSCMQERNSFWDFLSDNMDFNDLANLLALCDQDVYEAVIGSTFGNISLDLEVRHRLVLCAARTLWNMYCKVNNF